MDCWKRATVTSESLAAVGAVESVAASWAGVRLRLLLALGEKRREVVIE